MQAIAATEPMLTLVLSGPLTLCDSTGIEMTPRARKAQGLLALLGTSPGLKRSRSWLQDKLWSDRGPEQGAASLRQCLTEIRATLGVHADCLRAEAGWIALDPRRVRVVAELHGAAGLDCPEFLEGLDIRDPEFEDWLRDQRLARVSAEPAVRAAAPRVPVDGQNVAAVTPDRPLVLILPAQGSREELRLYAQMLCDAIAADIARAGNAQVVEGSGALAPRLGHGLCVLVRATEIGGTVYLQAQLSDLASRTILWVGLRALTPPAPAALDQDMPYSQILNEAVAAATNELGRKAMQATEHDRLTLLGYQASRLTVVFDPAEIAATDRMLAQAFDLHPMGVFLARRALLRHNQLYERASIKEATLRDEAIEFARRAIEHDPANATVLAAAAKVTLNLEGKINAGLELARRSVEIGPGNVLAWESLANGFALAERKQEAHAAALRARHFASALPQTFLWDMVCCVTATVLGRYDEAIAYGEKARELAPAFKPPLRYLAALYYQKGETAAARAQLNALRAVEPGFSLDMLTSPDYPAPVLRKTPLIRIAESGLG